MAVQPVEFIGEKSVTKPLGPVCSELVAEVKNTSGNQGGRQVRLPSRYQAT
jgi:hypothetical protein